jgi:hypothetical protein
LSVITLNLHSSTFVCSTLKYSALNYSTLSHSLFARPSHKDEYLWHNKIFLCHKYSLSLFFS